MEYLRVICLVMCLAAVCSEKTKTPNRSNKNNTISHIEVMVRPLNKKTAKGDVSHNQYSKHRSGKVAPLNTNENKTAIVNGVFSLLQNIGVNLSTKQSNKLYNFIPYPVNGRNTVFRILIYPKNSTQPNITYVLPDEILKNKNNGAHNYGNDDDSTRRIVLLDTKEYRLKNSLLEETLNSLPEVDHGSVQSGKSIHIKSDRH